MDVRHPDNDRKAMAVARTNIANAASASKAALRGDRRPASAQPAAMKRSSAAKQRAWCPKKPVAGTAAAASRTEDAAKAGQKLELYRLGGAKGRLVRLGSDTRVLEQMIKTARAQKRHPTDIMHYLSQYEEWLGALGGLRSERWLSQARPELIRKRMLCFIADRAAAGSPIDFRQMTMQQLKRLSPDVSEVLDEVTTQLPPHKLSRLLSVPADYCSMWGFLWKEALAAPGAFEFVMRNSLLLRESVTTYKALHNISPSPQVLLQIARRTATAGYDAGEENKGRKDEEDQGSKESEESMEEEEEEEEDEEG